MKIVIDIPNEKSENLIKQMKLDRNFRECKIIELPKGHDRLVEAHAVVKALFSHKTIDDVPTIIEADI